MHFDDAVYREGHYLDPEAYQPIGRVGGTGYVRLHERFTLRRPSDEL